MNDKIRYYKGVNKVKIVTESVGYYIIEALEPFEDFIDGKKIKVKIGEQRIVESNTLYSKMTYPSPIQEHAYELKMEKKLKQFIDQKQKKK
ncbi:hypothetical protein E2P47_04080 [Candidatus Bathyarchaeota archaeon]|nr:hypothetical protein E2P47_04080 [Candidatus Bathyarchaeota archaeon]